MRRVIAMLWTVFIILEISAPVCAVSTRASSAILMDANSNRILYEQNIHEKRQIASITKLMTALVAVEQVTDLDREIIIEPEWLGSEGSSIYLQAGERITMRGLLYGLLLQSGNDAAMAIACHISGDSTQFAALMNQKATDLGMMNSHFINPSGLNDKNHYSTAYDMALLACACLENEIVSTICKTQCATVGNRTFYNHNKLLHRYSGCIGMKTGYTELAGRTLVSAAMRNGQILVCVTLNDSNDWNDHSSLLDYGFDQYPSKILCKKGEVFGAVKVQGSFITCVPAVAKQMCVYPLSAGESVQLSVEITPILSAPIKAGTIVGQAVWTLNGVPVAQTELVCGLDINCDIDDRESLWDYFRTRIEQ